MLMGAVVGCWCDMQALQAQALSQQQAVADMVKQHQEVCGRLAAAATIEADFKQQLASMNSDKQALQQQIDRVRRLLQCLNRGLLLSAVHMQLTAAQPLLDRDIEGLIQALSRSPFVSCVLVMNVEWSR
jgi:hypothetical protein